MYVGFAAWPMAYVEMRRVRKFGTIEELKVAVEVYCAVSSVVYGFIFAGLLMWLILDLVRNFFTLNLLGFGPANPITWLVLLLGVGMAVIAKMVHFAWWCPRLYKLELKKKNVNSKKSKKDIEAIDSCLVSHL